MTRINFPALAIHRRLFRRACLALLVFCAALGAPGAHASDAYADWMADAQRLSSQQARNPGVLISYADPANGALLKSVFDPTRVAQVVRVYEKQAGADFMNTPEPMTTDKPFMNSYVRPRPSSWAPCAACSTLSWRRCWASR